MEHARKISQRVAILVLYLRCIDSAALQIATSAGIDPTTFRGSSTASGECTDVKADTNPAVPGGVESVDNGDVNSTVDGVKSASIGIVGTSAVADDACLISLCY